MDGWGKDDQSKIVSKSLGVLFLILSVWGGSVSRKFGHNLRHIKYKCFIAVSFKAHSSEALACSTKLPLTVFLTFH